MTKILYPVAPLSEADISRILYGLELLESELLERAAETESDVLTDTFDEEWTKVKALHDRIEASIWDVEKLILEKDD